MSVFPTYSAVEAIQVKKNINYVLNNIGIPSADLLAQMQQEGFSIDEFDTKQSADSTIMATQSVLLANIKAVFLSPEKLLGMLKSFSLAEKISIKTILTDSIAHLRLPSEALLNQMAQEGLTLNADDPEPATKTAASKKVLAAKNKLNQALSSTIEHPPVDEQKLKVTQARNKLATFLKNDTANQSDDLLIARKKQRLHSALQALDNPLGDAIERPSLKVVGD